MGGLSTQYAWTVPALSVVRLWIAPFLLLGVFGAAVASGPGPSDTPADAGEATVSEAPPSLEDLSERAETLRDGLAELERSYAEQVAPLERVLRTHSRDDELVHRIAVALVREGHAADVDPGLLLSVLLVEDPWLDLHATSPQGAIGLMQVMPTHAGAWGCSSPDLRDLDANICHGARILAHYLDASEGNLEVALLRYNGCVRGTNTPDCHLYPTKVYRRGAFAMQRTASR